MSRIRVAVTLCVAMLTTSIVAQTPSPAPPRGAPAQPKPGPPPPALPRGADAPEPAASQRAEPLQESFRGKPINIRIDVTIIDEGGPQATRKSVSVTVGDRQQGQVRAAVAVPGIGHVPIALDVVATLESDDRIRTRMTLDYRPSPRADPKEPMPVEMRLSFGIILESGKRIVAAQAADPVTDRRVSVEVLATVLK
jgi:hypothetical protein